MGSRRLFTEICSSLLIEGRSVRFRASGWSMEPAIRDGDLITVVPVRPECVAPGDVIYYLAERGPTVHRVVGEMPPERRAYRVSGDSAGPQSEVVPFGQVLGKVDSVQKREPRTLVTRAITRVERLVRLVSRPTCPSPLGKGQGGEQV